MEFQEKRELLRISLFAVKRKELLRVSRQLMVRSHVRRLSRRLRPTLLAVRAAVIACWPSGEMGFSQTASSARTKEPRIKDEKTHHRPVSIRSALVEEEAGCPADGAS